MSGNASMEKVLCVSVLVKFPRAETRAFLPQWKAGLSLLPNGTSGYTRRPRLVPIVHGEFPYDPLPPATEGPGIPQDANLANMSESLESTGNSETAVSSGEGIHLASQSGGDARITNLETDVSSLQASLLS